MSLNDVVYFWHLKPRSNDSNSSTQHIPTLLAQHLQAPAKRSQHLNATDRNIVGRNMLQAFGQGVTKQSNEVTSNEVTRNRVTGKKLKGSKISKSF